LERIEQEIASLEQGVILLAEALQKAYAEYLAVLGKTVCQQLILAGYHVCTQGYPEAFLGLSYRDRRDLQDYLRHLSREAEQDLQTLLQSPLPSDDGERSEEALTRADSGRQEPLNAEMTEFPESTTGKKSLTPGDLRQWQEGLERAIALELHALSHATNRLLQQKGILPHHLPEGMLEAAMHAELAEVRGNTPNLLNLVIEAVHESDSPADQEEESQNERSRLHILAIHLRLSEIEFSDTGVSAARSQIRSLTAKLKNLAQQYHKKQQERAIAAAQSAWRSTWTEGDDGVTV